MTVHELRRAITERALSVEEVARRCLARIEAYDGPDGLNAVAELDPAVLERARAMDSAAEERALPLFGIPILIKDNIDVAGLRTTAGSLALSDNVAARDAPIVRNLRRSGALILGKTNMTEFANYTAENMPGGYSSRGGQVRSAYSRALNPSGSSSGSAVAVSAGLCAAAIGTDTSFSIVGCATVNGVAGLKPPRGALSQSGIIPISHTLDSAGVLARDFEDALAVYSGMKDEPLAPVCPADPPSLRIAVNQFNRDMVSGAQMERYERLFGALRSAGVRLAEVSHPYASRQRDVMRCEFRRDLEVYLADSPARLKTLAEIVAFYEADPERRMPYGHAHLKAALMQASGALDDAAYTEAMAERERARESLLAGIRPFDACIMTGPTNIMHFTGLPSVALTLGMAEDGTPRGIILYGAEESRLYAAALAIEKYCLPVAPPNLGGEQCKTAIPTGGLPK